MSDMQVQAGAPLISSPPANELETAGSTSRRRLFVALVTVAVPVYVADQLTKAWVSANIQSDQPRDLVGSVLRLNLTHNAGAAFSIGTGATVVLTAIACAVVVFVVFTARRLGSIGWAWALGLLLGGSLGNLTDRLLRAPGPGRGHVVDFLQLPHFPIFNVADSAIVSAAALIGLLAFRGISVDGTRAHDDPPKHRTDEQPPGEQHPPETDSPKRVTGTDHDA
jgi:signal peptidase II